MRGRSAKRVDEFTTPPVNGRELLVAMPPRTSCSARSPYFLGASFEASHLRVSMIACVLHFHRILARRIGDLNDFLGHQISALFARARVHVGTRPSARALGWGAAHDLSD